MTETRPDGGSHWPVYVINMADNTARLARCTETLGAIGVAFSRFEAVNGRALGEDEVARLYDPKANRQKFRHPLVRGELGCYLSHIGLWRLLIEGSAPGAVILEDDFDPAPDLAKILNALETDTRPWDMVKLYSRRPEARMIGREPLVAGADLVRPYQIPNTTLGYVIRRDAAQRLLNAALPMARPIDEDHKRFWEHGLDIRLVDPPPLSLSEEAMIGDTIQAARRGLGQGPILSRLAQGWKTLRYRLAYLAQLHFHRLRGR